METIADKATLDITSNSFERDGYIPSNYTCEGTAKNPALMIKGIPQGTESLAIIMEDPDAPFKLFDHWLVWNIPPTEIISENFSAGVEGSNSKGELGYIGPCPPSGTHRYFFKVYALDTMINLEKGADKKQLEVAILDHVLAYGELMGMYKKAQENQ
jgi:Raf kinase inhibitor-like YbhB/YbcL family protein